MDDSTLSLLLTVVDFETEAIGARPNAYPPEPVGVAIRWPDGTSEYLAWGHPDNNNCTFEEAVRAVRMAFAGPVLFHNAAFDIEIAVERMGLEWPAIWHDTLFLLFLSDPHAQSFSLKPSAERILGEAPTEQDALRDWILANVKGSKRSDFGAYIAQAPVAIVGDYAIGDTSRTWNLFWKLWPEISGDAGMLDAYNREKKLCPHLVAAEKRGIRVDRTLLYEWLHALDDTPGSGGAIDRCDELIRARLNAPALCVDSDDELVLALEREKLMDRWLLTDGTIEETVPMQYGTVAGPNITVGEFNPFGVEDEDLSGIVDRTAPKPVRRTKAKRSVSKKGMMFCRDSELVATLEYRNTAATMLRTFVRPWLQQSETDGRLHTKWHQVRGQDKNGTRTGRIASADPNLANVPNPKDIKPPAPGLPFLPSMRMALLPEPGHVWISVDYSQQELRLTAHFEDGDMMLAYIANPKLDLHDYAQKLIYKIVGKMFERKPIKNVAFASIYGAGDRQLAGQMGTSVENAVEVRNAYFKALPGLPALIEAVKSKARRQGYVRSLGGRMIKLEQPRLIKGRMRVFDYKMVNHLVQGSAADQTKEAICNFCENGFSNYFLGQVYDEINASVPYADAAYVTDALVHYMKCALPIDVPMVCDVEWGPSWGALKPHEHVPVSEYVGEPA